MARNVAIVPRVLGGLPVMAAGIALVVTAICPARVTPAAGRCCLFRRCNLGLARNVRTK